MDSKEISRLVEKSKNGDKNSFGELYRLTAKSVYYTCLKLTANESAAQDIMQDSYTYAFEKLSELKNPESFIAWISRIAINKCNSYFNAEKKHAEIDIDELADDDLTYDDILFEEDKRKILMNIIDNKLTTAQRQSVILFYYNGLSVSQIAQIMDCPESTVTSRLRLARDKIKTAVLEYEKSEDTKLHSISPLLFFQKLFELDSNATALPSSAATPVFINSGKKPTLGHGGTQMVNALKTKIIIGAISAAVVAGGITAAVVISGNKDNEKDNSSSSSITVDSQSSSSEIIAPDDSSSSEPSQSVSFDGISVGEYVSFGAYEQDNDTSNGKEPIEWEVLEIKDGRAFLVSKYCLDCQPYDIGMAGMTWETCSLRKWLNESFLNEAFNSQEQSVILNSELSTTGSDMTYGDNGEQIVVPYDVNTVDKVFILSIEEYNNYYTYNRDNPEATASAPTEFAIANGVYVSSATLQGITYAQYWLRDSHSVGAAFTTIYGVHDTYKHQSHSLTAVRPAVWVTVE